ncbi:MAG: Pr6Pr family membrane protein [Acidimicrobiia bacterium]|nr:Pr6Pr family membrane protein [Acidimicrobiia bacterium]
MTVPVTSTAPARGTGSVARGVRTAVGVAILVSLVVSFADAAGVDGFNPVNYFSYFTIESNILAMVLMLGQAIVPAWMVRNGRFRGAVTLYMTVTLLVYAVILRPLGADVGEYRVWVDYIQHTAGPIALIGDWFLFPPRDRYPSSLLAKWLVFPLAFLVYSLIRGSMVEWYPYPFLDPADGGYLAVTIASVAILVVFIALGSLIRWWPGYAQVHPDQIPEASG